MTSIDIKYPDIWKALRLFLLLDGKNLKQYDYLERLINENIENEDSYLLEIKTKIKPKLVRKTINNINISSWKNLIIRSHMKDFFIGDYLEVLILQSLKNINKDAKQELDKNIIKSINLIIKDYSIVKK